MSGGWLKPGLGLAGSAVLGLGLAASFGLMEASSNSTFCGSCHIMETYHASWSDSTHSEVACVECHIPAGLGAGIQKKLDGLSMLTKTMTGEVSTHITAHVADDVCLRCHERRLLVGREWFDTVLFDHRPHLTKLRRGVQLNCSSCHSQIVQGDHITVTGSSCLVCHFHEREAGSPEADCAVCHQVDGLVAERGAHRFDHSRAAELGVACTACHEPMPAQANMVPRERCLTCHNKPERLAEAGRPQKLMDAHIRQSRAQCGDCHQNLLHVGKRRKGSDMALCEDCERQSITPPLTLYADLDNGRVGPMVSPMYTAGVRCEGCHEERFDKISKPATSVSCLKCHPLGIERLFGWWRESVGERQKIARGMLEQTAAELGLPVSASLGDAEREIELVEQAGGVHNLRLAMSLLDSAVARIAARRLEAGLAPLKTPWPEAQVDSSCFVCHQGTESRSVESFGRDFGHAVHIDAGKLECEKCHSSHDPRRQPEMASLLFEEPGCQGCHHEQIDLETCGSCHEDLHRAEFAGARCDQCHVAEFWSPAPGFDHQAVEYQLTGAHLDVACAECHIEKDLGGNLLVRYRGLNYGRCEDCHDDPHAVALGSSCESCHVTASWQSTDREQLDHEITRYPLRGAHVEVECESCHPTGASIRIENHQTCSTCHDDAHLGQFASQERGPECEPCHSVSGFLPTLYSPDDHQDSAFPLRGAHLAVPCDSCHEQASETLVASLALASPAIEIPARNARFRFESTTCADCHEDPHSGSTDEFMTDKGCEACHVEDSWARVAFDHRLESYTLEGKHLDVPCSECHPRLPEGGAQCVKLRGVPLTCAGCHENPHAQTSASNARTADCERCHTAADWTTTAFEHRRDTRFPLIAAHSDISCSGCHVDARYEQTSPECRDCHVDPHRGELGISCDRCHTPHSWKHNVEALTTHSATLFPLDGAHSTLECEGCHAQEAPFEFSSTQTDCYSCHQAEYSSTVNPDHELLTLSTDCSSCHDSRSWLGATIDTAVTIDHDLVFPLTGAHLGVECAECHSQGYAGTPRDCIGCHRSDFESTTEPNHPMAAFPGDCTLCHTTAGWLGASFTHETGYVLAGAHRELDCAACHTTSFGGTSTDCYSCHQDDWTRAEPDHAAAGFDTDCSSCHNERRWDRADFEHSNYWRLTGGHRKLECTECHGQGYAGTSSECYSCHRKDYRRVTDPDHRSAGFGTECEDCHGTRTWSGGQIDHDEVFRLVGAHRQLDCQECHASGYTGTPRDCYACHQGDYLAVQDPNHRTAGYSTDCTGCHNQANWLDVQMDHGVTFPLSGAHRGLDCVACHAAGYTGTPTDCVSCHLADYNGTRNPDHRTADMGTACLDCHTTHGWSNAEFEHDQAYALEGAHRQADCAACHARGYTGTPRDCASCHQTDYDKARKPDHRRSGFPQDCALCHSTDSWLGADLEHDGFYALTGAHDSASCQSCHARGYAGTPRYCSGCHQADYDGTRDPNHRAAGFSTDCTACHTTTRWPGAALDHEPYYSLTGAHATADCSSCHAGGYAGTPRDCADCHSSDYDATVDPDHGSAGFPRDCSFCHETDRWRGAAFTHDTYYPLTGFHTLLGCTRCHSGGFGGTPRECSGCHLDDYQDTVNPYHQVAQFPLQCETCHSTAVWYGARFLEHDSRHFPIYSGAHDGRWGSCKTCHRVTTDYQVYSCTICHSHRRDRMDRFHESVVGYEFENTACYSCHPNGTKY